MKFSHAVSVLVGLIALSQEVTAEATCDSISKYSTEWFLANTKPEFSSSYLESTALFYTAGLSEKAKQFAKKGSSKKVTIWEVWPCEYYRHRATRSNPLSCIMDNASDQLTYFENMSRAFAMKAHNVAWAMHRNIENPPLSTIWGRVELPILQDSRGMVNWITAIEAENLENRKITWMRNVRMLKEEAEAVMQRILFARDEDVEGAIEERDFDSCELRVDSSHPLY